jgi:glutathione synthase/RimK-type ligase-like ATP-grasp enzyme
MEHTPSVEEMVAIVQEYIYERKRVRVRIVFDNPMSMRKHIIMLNEAYSYVLAYRNNTNTK